MTHLPLHEGHILEAGPISLMRAIYGRDREDRENFEYILDYDRLEVARVMDEVFDTLSERERLVIKARFGLNPGDSAPRTLEKASRLLRGGTPFGRRGVSRERIRQLQMSALRKLRHPYRRSQLDRYLVRTNEEV